MVGKQLTLKTVLAGTSLEDLQRRAVAEAVEKTVGDVLYDKPEYWFNKFDILFGAQVASTTDVENFAEAKATRDVLEHAGGRVGHQYVKKAGRASRFIEGDLVDVGTVYHDATFNLVRRLVAELSDAAIDAEKRVRASP